MNRVSATGTGHRCSHCGSWFPTVEQARACAATPVVPPHTKYLTVVSGHVISSLFLVREIEGEGCKQHVTLKPHPAFWTDMKHEFRGQKKGFSLLLSRHQEQEEGMPVPLTSEMAKNAVTTLDHAIRQRELYLEQLKRRRRFFDHFARVAHDRPDEVLDLDEEEDDEEA